MILDGGTVNIGVAFVAGLIAFFAPCVLPLLPAYIGYFAGVGVNDEHIKEKRWQIFRQSLFFVAGFLVVFVILGLSATWLGGIFASNREIIQRIGGVVMVLLGLYLLELFKLPSLYRELKFDVHKQFGKNKSLNASLLGLTFGFAWTPCIGPVLAVILFWASQTETAVRGMLMLLVFGLGIAVPFLIIGLFIDKLLPLLRKSGRVQVWIHRIAGILVLIFGVLLLIDQFDAIHAFFVSLGSLEEFLLDRF